MVAPNRVAGRDRVNGGVVSGERRGGEEMNLRIATAQKL